MSSELEEENMRVDRQAKDAAKCEVPNEMVESALIPNGKISIEDKPVYNKKNKKLIREEEATYNQEKWAVTKKDNCSPFYLLWSLVLKEYEKNHIRR